MNTDELLNEILCELRQVRQMLQYTLGPAPRPPRRRQAREQATETREGHHG